MSISYDRIAPDYFTKELAKAGCFDRLVRFANEEPLLDLQFRSAREAEPRVTLYYGLTALLDVQGRRETNPDDPLFELRPHKGREATTRLPAPLKGWQTATQLRRSWPEIEDYLKKLMTEMNRRWIRGEGGVPSSLNGTGLISVIDSEVVLRFSNDQERRRIKGELNEKLQGALSKPRAGEPWWKVRASFGNELDVLGVDGRGRVLLVELKQASDTSGIAWAPAQVSAYRELFERWVAQEPAHAEDVLNRMLRQRRRLGLAGGGEWAIATPLRLVPVVGIGGNTPSKEAMRRCHLVQETLVQAGIGYDDLEVWEFGGVRRRGWRELASTAP
jgi:hypothetical protein